MLPLRDALEVVGLTDTGRFRDHNEDAIGFDPEMGFVILADGMGGYNAGEVASGITVEEMSAALRAGYSSINAFRRQDNEPWAVAYNLMRQSVELANAVVYTTAQRDPRFAGMGTTLVSGLFFDNKVLIAHVGDSRAYRWRDGVLAQLTRDHSFLQEQLDAGLILPEEAAVSQFKNLVTRAVGVEASVVPELQAFGALPGDVYLFCSDGLTDMLGPSVLSELLLEQSSSLMMTACSLVEHANEAGGLDNISVLLVKVRRDFRIPRGLWSRIMSWLV